MTAAPDQSSVTAVLAGVTDPESGRPLTDMGQVLEVAAAADAIAVTVGLTTHSAILWATTRGRIEELLRSRFPTVQDVRVTIRPHDRPPAKLGQIGLEAKSVIAVGSGKGGVGKSTIAASLAIGLARAGSRVGLLDADVYGPSVPHLLGLSGRPQVENGKIVPMRLEVGGGTMPVMSMGFLVPAGEAVVWRGPMLHGAITQMLRDTLWGPLDYLVIDMPPGTGDIALTLSQVLPLTGAVVVCTPQDVALLDATKAIAMFRQAVGYLRLGWRPAHRAGDGHPVPRRGADPDPDPRARRRRKDRGQLRRPCGPSLPRSHLHAARGQPRRDDRSPAAAALAACAVTRPRRAHTGSIRKREARGCPSR
jgi:ATP-binding protein involved in chromosome partitioning